MAHNGRTPATDSPVTEASTNATPKPFVGSLLRSWVDLTTLGIDYQYVRRCHGYGNGLWTAFLFRYFESVVSSQDAAQLRETRGIIGSLQGNVLKARLRSQLFVAYQQETSNLLSALDTSARPSLGWIEDSSSMSTLVEAFQDMERLPAMINHFKILLACYVWQNWQHYGYLSQPYVEPYFNQLRDLQNHDLDDRGLQALADMLGVTVNVVYLRSGPPGRQTVLPSHPRTDVYPRPAIDLLSTRNHYDVLYPHSEPPCSDVHPTVIRQEPLYPPLATIPSMMPEFIETHLGDRYPQVLGQLNPGATHNYAETPFPATYVPSRRDSTMMPDLLDGFFHHGHTTFTDMLGPEFNPQINPSYEDYGQTTLGTDFAGRDHVYEDLNMTGVVSDLPEPLPQQDHSPTQAPQTSQYEADQAEPSNITNPSGTVQGGLRWRESEMQYKHQKELPKTTPRSGGGSCRPHGPHRRGPGGPGGSADSHNFVQYTGPSSSKGKSAKRE
ncbi:hypothetical protein C1H76_8818 [Elsinoe australis]|uniref:ubiquitinyl hydrolase 1 n=1 Tax=Elsinoe australis TaxID=40998 RepID=A0A4U7AMA5_9PEZI|nr:hypothetical protein C1H76_8818 [Elsinoe australis]